MTPEELVEAARDARTRAYAPYSGFHVGAAVLTASGGVYSGCNVENASYGLTNCAERAAVFAAVAAGDRAVRAIAVAAPGGASMCGACRQVVREFGDAIEVYLADENGEFRATSISELLPGAFDGGRLTGDSGDGDGASS